MRLTRAWVEIDLGALRRNAVAMAARAQALLPMVKADAYGVGAVPVARALESVAPWGYGVATVEEGAELRAAGIVRPLVVFTPLHAGDFAVAHVHGLIPVLSRASEVREWMRGGSAAWHLGVDTGMNRAGARWDDAPTLRGAVAVCAPAGVCTHFHSAELDDGSMAEQESRFRQAVGLLPAQPALRHAENSAALARRERSPWELSRPGIFLYGVGSGNEALVQPEPVVSLRARIVDVRTVPHGETVSYEATHRAVGERSIATIPLGYGDGYPRSASNRGSALVRGRRVPVVGIVTMDMIMLDVTDVPCAPGDVATLIGRDGEARLDVADVAKAADVSPYELLTRLHGRLPRRYESVP